MHNISACCQQTPEDDANTLELKFQAGCKPPLRVLETKCRSYARPSRAPNHTATLPSFIVDSYCSDVTFCK